LTGNKKSRIFATRKRRKEKRDRGGKKSFKIKFLSSKRFSTFAVPKEGEKSRRGTGSEFRYLEKED